ncbi:hypothetical protein, partial [Mycolicibacterium hodleri]|uniref:hypothetical protein n=1 Tax=Mycolicibacterium hodleri TaxID=49897 RepID=UPI0021F331D0
QTKTTRQNQVHRKSEKSDIQQPVKTGKKNKTIPTAGRREVPHQDGQKQQTKTTKHTIEFSNNRLDCVEVPRFGATLPA